MRRLRAEKLTQYIQRLVAFRLGRAPAEAGQKGLDVVQQVVVRQRLLRLALAHDPVPELHIAGAEVLAALRAAARPV